MMTMMVTGRLSRFGDWAPLQPLCVTGRFTGARPFFAGTEAYDRMDLVRRAINDIRVNWDQYPTFMRELRGFIEGAGSSGSSGSSGASGARSAEPENRAGKLAALYSSVKEWSAPGGEHNSADYSAIRLYASDEGYRKMFGMINLALRDEKLAGDPLALRSAAFLVELLNIDLYNFRGSNPAVDNFEGHVYRGMCVSEEGLRKFARVTDSAIHERYLSIPLAMASASRSRANALAFAVEQASREPGTYPLLWDIAVYGLNPDLLAFYLNRFPASIVTSLCAVPIDPLSDYPEEAEVLLNKPHFQIIRFWQEGTGAPQHRIHAIEAVMLNSSRDHISAIASNTGEDRSARDLFRTLIIAHRSAICAERAAAHGLSADARSYRVMFDEACAGIDSFAR